MPKLFSYVVDHDYGYAPSPFGDFSPEMQKVFGTFGGHVSIQRSPPRWVEPAFVDRAVEYLKGLE